MPSRSGTTADTFAPTSRAEVGPKRVRIDLPLLDLPYNAGFGGRTPSMQQSLAITTGVYNAAHVGVARVFGDESLRAKVVIAVFDALTISVPATDAWLHEEWHRAVLGARGVNSRNAVYSLRNIVSSSISVDHATDEDLARLKREHPAEFIRLKAAGIEGEYAMVRRLEQDRFYRGNAAWHAALYWLVVANSVLYVADFSGVDADMRAANKSEKTVASRDISGHDFTAWVRDLFRPTEPWESRGVHPSGIGVNRYVLSTDLTPGERAYLRRQGRLAFLNLLDPSLVGFSGVTLRTPGGGPPLRANLTIRHLLTSFGHSLDANVFLKRGDVNVFLVLHAYANHDRSFPGASVELIDHSVTLGGRRFELSPRLSVWTQPKRQQFRTRAGRVGGLAALRVRTPFDGRLGALAEVEAKTAGWAAGVVQLDRAVNVRLGLSARLW